MLATEKLFALDQERRHPRRIVRVNAPGELDEGVPLSPRLDLGYFYLRHDKLISALGAAGYAVFRQIVNETDRGAGQQLESAINKLNALVTDIASDRSQIAAQATAASELTERLTQRMAAAPFDAQITLRLLKSISGDADYIAAAGERAAEQAVMSLDVLLVAYTRNVKVDNAEQIRSAIRGLREQLERDPSSYNAVKFAPQMRAVKELLR